ncbi:MAG: Holliday junction branch migration protein RuvA [Clostridia bacterium]|nr:Holliday junction branch migration protein RuvA [Clostridia bacterium]MBR3790772.1 Holliday junction branch migration protein RuvA [Clostridia bacterium]
MISYIKGEVAEKYDGKIVVECGGIGYALLCSTATLATAPPVGAECKLHTIMLVKEDDISLIGFSSLEEKNLFELLVSVSGVGPKVALAMLSGMKISDLVVAISSGDTVALSRIKGLGKKTAERLVLELQDKVTPAGITPLERGYIIDNEDAIESAFQVLLSLGLTKQEALHLARTNGAGLNSAEEIVAKALKNMGR